MKTIVLTIACSLSLFYQNLPVENDCFDLVSEARKCLQKHANCIPLHKSSFIMWCKLLSKHPKFFFCKKFDTSAVIADASKIIANNIPKKIELSLGVAIKEAAAEFLNQIMTMQKTGFEVGCGSPFCLECLKGTVSACPEEQPWFTHYKYTVNDAFFRVKYIENLNNIDSKL